MLNTVGHTAPDVCRRATYRRQGQPNRRTPMYACLDYTRFRDTTAVRFFDITVELSNTCDLVEHDGPAISPPNLANGDWQFYLHSRQEDNLLAVSGGRTFVLINLGWEHPLHVVRLAQRGQILRIPPGTFHRSLSDVGGSIVINQAIRHQNALLEREFRLYSSAVIPALRRVLMDWQEANPITFRRLAGLTPGLPLNS